jgi:hypothetical protein
VIGRQRAWHRHLGRVLIWICLLATMPAAAAHAAELEQPPGWSFEVRPNLPESPGQTAEFVVVAREVTTSTPAEVTWQFRLLLPDGEEARFGLNTSGIIVGFPDVQDIETDHWQNADAGPYVGRVVWLDRDRETVVAETSAWLGSPDAPLLRLQSLQTDPPTPRVGEPSTVSVAVTNDGNTSGSRLAGVWVWPDQQSYLNIGTLGFYDVAPGETRTESFVWVPKLAVSGTRLTASKTELSRGLALEPYTVLPAATAAGDGALAADAEQGVSPDQPAEDGGG